MRIILALCIAVTITFSPKTVANPVIMVPTLYQFMAVIFPLGVPLAAMLGQGISTLYEDNKENLYEEDFAIVYAETYNRLLFRAADECEEFINSKQKGGRVYPNGLRMVTVEINRMGLVTSDFLASYKNFDCIVSYTEKGPSQLVDARFTFAMDAAALRTGRPFMRHLLTYGELKINSSGRIEVLYGHEDSDFLKQLTGK